MNPEETDEPSDEEIALWLQTPEGSAAMQQIMLDVKEGRYGEMGPELLEAVEVGLEARESLLAMEEAQGRILALIQRLTEPVNGSRWQHMHDLNEEMKAIMDLLLEMPEPQRTTLMQMALSAQEALEELEKQQ